MTTDLLVCAGVVGAVLLSATKLAGQEGWLARRDPGNIFANLIGAGLLFVSVFGEWNTAVAFLAVQWAALSLYGLRTVLSRRS